MPNENNSKVFIIGAFVAIGGFLFGYEIAVMSGILIIPDFKNKMCINEDQSKFDPIVGSIVSILLSGCFCGSLLAGQLSDRFSRKYSISLFSFVCTIGTLIQTTSGLSKGAGHGPLIQLLIGRFITGELIIHLFVFVFYRLNISDEYRLENNQIITLYFVCYST